MGEEVLPSVCDLLADELQDALFVFSSVDAHGHDVEATTVTRCL